jgi:hypothetical protein
LKTYIVYQMKKYWIVCFQTLHVTKNEILCVVFSSFPVYHAIVSISFLFSILFPSISIQSYFPGSCRGFTERTVIFFLNMCHLVDMHRSNHKFPVGSCMGFTERMAPGFHVSHRVNKKALALFYFIL